MILNDEQKMLKDTAADFCRKNAPVEQLRRLRDAQEADGFDRSTWQSMVELGWTGIPWAEEFGGLDFGYKGLGVVTKETGRTLTASPLFASIWLGGTLINVAGSQAQKAELLPRLVQGEMLLTLALEEGHHHQPHRIVTSAEAEARGFRLSGEKTFVLDGQIADLLLVAARTSGQADDLDGVTLFLVPRDAVGVTIEPLSMTDSRNAARMTLQDVVVSSDAVLGQKGSQLSASEGNAREFLDRALDIARIGLAAEMQGSLEECFERTVDYLKERQQFGVPIGSFQALQHRAADMFCEVELSNSVVLEALTALDEGRDGAEIATLASLAKSRVGDTFKRVTREAVQMHGGNGMTDEFEIGFFIKRAAVAEQLLGNAQFHRNRYGALKGY